MTQTIEQRARELLAKHYELSGTRHYADELRNGYQGQPQALAALTEALTRMEQLEGALTPNSELAGEISAIIINDAITFADRREAGISASMNGALDYTTYSILQAVKRHMGIKE